MLQLSFKQSNLQSQLILGCKADDGLHTAGKGNRDGAGTLANQFQKISKSSQAMIHRLQATHVQTFLVLIILSMI